MPAQGCRCFAVLRRALIRYVGDNHVAPVDAAHEGEIEGTRAARRIDLAKVRGDGRISAYRDPPAALLPQQELDQPLHIAVIDRDIGAPMRKDGGMEYA